MNTVIGAAVLAAYVAFWVRLFLHARLWCAAGKEADPRFAAGSPASWAGLLLDMLFFRRLFESDKLLWIGSWTFHASFVLVVLRHLRYFFPIPASFSCFQPVGIAAGYLLPVSAAMILLLRLGAQRGRYLSLSNYLLLGMIFLIGTTGVMMRLLTFTDPVSVKAFTTGVFAFRWGEFPSGSLLISHLLLALALITMLPLHIFTAPLVTADARFRQEGLERILHE